VRVLLISTYDLGRQPFGLASPAAWMRRAGVDVECVDTSRSDLSDAQIRAASIIGLYLPMHTATRLAGPVVERVRTIRPDATMVAYGLYAPLNEEWLRSRGVTYVLGPECEADLVRIAATGPARPENERAPEPSPHDRATPVPRLAFIQPDRSTLPALTRYAALQMPDGSRRVAGSTDATRGCKHLCRHCPIVPVYKGAFRVVPIDVVLADVRAQVSAGARHISFGDPDFLNAPTHTERLVRRLAHEFPGLSYDATIKIEHIVKHPSMLPLLRDTGCLFVTSAVESIDDAVLEKLRKGHTRADFVRAVMQCRDAGLALSPTFVPFTPWTTLEGYAAMVTELADLGLQSAVAPIQLAIRLLVTADSALLDLADVRQMVEPFDPSSLTWPWRHADPRVDAIQREVMLLVDSMRQAPREQVFEAVMAIACRRTESSFGRPARLSTRPAIVPPYLTENWYCCAEPTFALGTSVGKPSVALGATAGKPAIDDYV
jgi:radical SAM superfamily enzyme YgiQ (UPF0313 family)